MVGSQNHFSFCHASQTKIMTRSFMWYHWVFFLLLVWSFFGRSYILKGSVLDFWHHISFLPCHTALTIYGFPSKVLFLTRSTFSPSRNLGTLTALSKETGKTCLMMVCHWLPFSVISYYPLKSGSLSWPLSCLPPKESRCSPRYYKDSLQCQLIHQML